MCLTFQTEGVRFNYRVGSIIINNGDMNNPAELEDFDLICQQFEKYGMDAMEISDNKDVEGISDIVIITKLFLDVTGVEKNTNFVLRKAK